MIATLDRETAREEARARLSEILEVVVPGFRPERAFRCLNPNHEDRHPSARYLSRANMVKCFSCGWSGDVFSVVAAVYGLTDGEAFKKTYDLLGLEIGNGGARRAKRTEPAKPKPSPDSVEYLVSLIWPNGADEPAPVVLPMPLEVTATVETGIAGRLARSPEAVERSRELGLEGRHFEDGDLDDFFDDLAGGAMAGDYDPDFLTWATARAIPYHMVGRSARFIVANGRRRMLEGLFARMFSHVQNGEAPGVVLSGLFEGAEAITGDRYAIPANADDLGALVGELFERYSQNDDLLAVMRKYRADDAAQTTVPDAGTLARLEAGLVAACLLLNLDADAIRERAAVYEIDAGNPRDRATRRAFAEHLKTIKPEFPKCLADWLLDNAPMFLNAELAGTTTRRDTMHAIAKALGVLEKELFVCA